MREIKFRAWAKEDKIMMTVEDSTVSFDISADGVVVSYYEEEYYEAGGEIQSRIVSPILDADVMQYIGLLDKNCKDIYEKDICIDDNGEPVIVVWSVADCGFRIVGIHDKDYEDSIDDSTKLEIIGNIYENPELLS